MDFDFLDFHLGRVNRNLLLYKGSRFCGLCWSICSCFNSKVAIYLASISLREKVSKIFIFLASIAILGGYPATFGNKPFLSLDNKSIIASFSAMLASFCWASSIVLEKATLRQIYFELMTCIRLIVIGTVAMLIIISSGNFSDI